MAQESALARLLSGLKREPHDYRSTLQVFPDLNVERIAEELDLDRLGADRGQRNEPPTTSSGFDEVELRIIERVEAEKKSAHGILLDQLSVYSERLTALDFEGRFGLIRQAAPEAVGNLKAEAAQGRDELHGLRRALLDLEQERNEFRNDHGLKRTARMVSGGSTMLKLGILLLLLAIETIANGTFLGEGHILGLFGGTRDAFFFAALNVLVSAGLGYFGVRQLNHPRWRWKIVGFLSVVFYVVFNIGLNLALAHLRELSSEGGRTA